MKLHSNVITTADVYAAVREHCPGVVVDTCEVQGSRSRKIGFKVLLESDGTPDKAGTPRRFARNVGTSGRYPGQPPGFAASYDDWGWFLSALFALDPDLIAGPYKGVEDFDAKTEGKYSAATAREGAPA
jgi:hypothetical protein